MNSKKSIKPVNDKIKNWFSYLKKEIQSIPAEFKNKEYKKLGQKLFVALIPISLVGIFLYNNPAFAGFIPISDEKARERLSLNGYADTEAGFFTTAFYAENDLDKENLNLYLYTNIDKHYGLAGAYSWRQQRRGYSNSF